jgi:hypothetical protein
MLGLLDQFWSDWSDCEEVSFYEAALRESS